MTSKSEIAERLRATLAKELKQDVNAITPQHTLRDDLGLNSLDAIELMFKIEEEFDISIPDEDMQRLLTVGDVISYLESKTGGAHATPGRTASSPPKPQPARQPARAPKPAAKRKSSKPKGSRRHA
jgi:acyl carrier protein